MLKRNLGIALTLTCLTLAVAQAGPVERDANQDFLSAHRNTGPLRQHALLSKQLTQDLKQAGDSVPTRLQPVTAPMIKAATTVTKAAFHPVKTAMKIPGVEQTVGAIKNAHESATAWAKPHLDSTGNFISGHYDSKVKPVGKFFGDKYDYVAGKISGAYRYTSDKISGAYRYTADKITGAYRYTAGKISGAYASAKAAITSNGAYQATARFLTAARELPGKLIASIRSRFADKTESPVLLLTNGTPETSPIEPAAQPAEAKAAESAPATKSVTPIESDAAKASDKKSPIDTDSGKRKKEPLIVSGVDGFDWINENELEASYKMSLHEVRTLMGIGNSELFSLLGVIKIGNEPGQEAKVVGINVNANKPGEKARYFIFGNEGDEFTQDFNFINTNHQEHSGFLEFLKVDGFYTWAKSDKLNLRTKLNVPAAE